MLPQFCPGCFESRWEVRKTAVQCATAAAVVSEYRAAGYEVRVKFYRDEEIGPVCDVLAYKWR